MISRTISASSQVLPGYLVSMYILIACCSPRIRCPNCPANHWQMQSAAVLEPIASGQCYERPT